MFTVPKDLFDQGVLSRTRLASISVPLDYPSIFPRFPFDFPSNETAIKAARRAGKIIPSRSRLFRGFNPFGVQRRTNSDRRKSIPFRDEIDRSCPVVSPTLARRYRHVAGELIRRYSGSLVTRPVLHHGRGGISREFLFASHQRLRRENVTGQDQLRPRAR